MRLYFRFVALLCWFAAVSSAHAAGFVLSSAGVGEGKTVDARFVFAGFGCSGGNQSPALSWQGAPAGTRSFALTMYDPDAPTGSGWWHWVIVNLPADVQTLPINAGTADGKSLPATARQITTDFGVPGYGGPCPPAGASAHRYIFTLHALDIERLDLPPNATAAMAGFMIGLHRVGSAQMEFRYGRPAP
jgi:Raf kinase inhibitor-like YbhB/YbcL family protein